MPRALVAPDDFKGTFTAPQVASAIAVGLSGAGVEADELPIADGGDGTMNALLVSLGGELRTARVSDPLGRPTAARWAMLSDGDTAVIEMAQASGLGRVAPQDRDAWAASTRGTGELIVLAAREGARKVLVAVGGSATTDGGAGARAALREADVNVPITVLCDVRVPFEDAARVFGPQKGADPEMVVRLTERLESLARSAPRDPRGLEMTGAAGGLSGGLWAYCGAELVDGARFVLDAVRFDQRLQAADFAISGEGRLDQQTLTGKAVAEVARRCRAAERPLHVVAGSSALTAAETDALLLASVREATTIGQLEAAGYELALTLTSRR
ncbi:MAG: glycerate kinase [Solirubrobacterales bacterium]|nr:glycerate kinase [Solirubrobacterales bacterium]MBV9809706.1 glycerate kinase [Solirubrobacterales bacterium]